MKERRGEKVARHKGLGCGYCAERMGRRSRYGKFLQTLDEATRRAVSERTDVLIERERMYCDRGNYKHLCDIFTAIALYETLQERGMPEPEAFDTLASALYRSVQPRRELFMRLAKRRWFWPVMKRIVPLGFRLGSGMGWRFTWRKDLPKNEFCFETNACIYREIFCRRGLDKLGPMFCKCDILTYGELPGIDFVRTGTLCYGCDRCDFRFVRYEKGEPFTRTESR